MVIHIVTGARSDITTHLRIKLSSPPPSKRPFVPDHSGIVIIVGLCCSYGQQSSQREYESRWKWGMEKDK